MDAEGWTVLVLEHIDGRHADYAPGSPDLAQVAKLVTGVQGIAAPGPVTMRVAARWESLFDTSPMDGGSLLHADINNANVLLTPDGRARLVDWAFASRGASWVELALMIPWLVKAGHTPAEAEAWAAQFPSWMTADPGCLTAFTAAFAERWRRRATRPDSEEWVRLHAATIRRWAEHRLR